LVFLVALAVLTKRTVFREVINDDDHENILLLALPTLPQHSNGAVLMPRQLPPCPLSPLHVSVLRSWWGGWGDDNNKQQHPRGDDNINNVRPRLPDTQQSAIGKGGGGGGDKDDKEEDCDGCWRMTGKAVAALAKRRRVQ
jgi:hypothetical protein